MLKIKLVLPFPPMENYSTQNVSSPSSRSNIPGEGEWLVSVLRVHAGAGPGRVCREGEGGCTEGIKRQ